MIQSSPAAFTNQGPSVNELTNLLALPDSEYSQRFLALWTSLEKDARAFVSLVDLSQHRHMLYVSQQQEKILGYPRTNFLNDIDFAFFHVICPPEEMPGVSAMQAKYALETRQPNFSITLPQ